MFSKFNEFNKVLFKYDLRENKKKTKKKWTIFMNSKNTIIDYSSILQIK